MPFRMKTYAPVLCLVVMTCFAGCGDSGSSATESDAKKSPDNSVETAPLRDSKTTDPKTDNESASKDANTDKTATTDAAAAELKVSVSVVGRNEYDELLKSHEGDIILVDFWATWCTPCQKAFPHTVKLFEQYHDQGLTVISVSMDDLEEPETKGKIVTFLEQNNAVFDNLISTLGYSEESFDEFEIPDGALPHFKVYDRKGKLRHSFETDVTADQQFTHEDVEAKVKELLAEK